MSFFRSIRSSMTRGKSSPPRENTPVRSSRPASATGSMSGRRDSSVDSRADSLFNRSDTFILANRDSDVEDKSHSNTSTLEKKSKKFKALSKFSTFTKRKKLPTSPASDNASPEHHPSENATNTYYKWQSETPSNMDYDAKTDPFHFLYEQPSSLQSLQSSNGLITDLTERRSNTINNTSYDPSTYRKAKGPTTLLRGQLEQKRSQTSARLAELENENENEAEKYKTVTLNSFRKSFREKFLQQQNEAPHNPAWFVEVEPPISKKTCESRKENTADVLVFENDNYRPESRSPVRDRKTRPSRSPVKRNDTFRVDRSLTGERELPLKTEQPSIRIEIRNSITPNLPGRIVPVGVAKPFTTNFYNQQSKATYPHTSAKLTATTNPKYQSTSPARGLWSKLQPYSEISEVKNSNRPGGRYQTLVQIRNESNQTRHQTQQQSPIVNRSSLPIRIQLGGNESNTPTPQKRQNVNQYSSSRYTMNSQPSATINSYEYHKNSNRHKSLSAKPSKTYFGDVAVTTGSRMTGNDYGGCYVGAPATPTTTTTITTEKTCSCSTIPTNGYANRSYIDRQLPQQHQHQHQHQYQQQHQHRLAVVPVQRRSRSPIKMPWR